MAMDEILCDGFGALSLTLPAGAAERFAAYYRLLTERGAVMNLTAITGEEVVARLHFLDCAALLRYAPFAGARVIDVGSGAGFPGLVLKLAEPDIRLTLLDSQQKRVEFLREACAALGLSDVVCVHARAEEAAEYRETFDIAVSRAVARLNLLCELCLPLVRPGGVFLAMKGPDCAEEAAEAENAEKTLGGAPGECLRYTVPGTEVVHSVVRVEKRTATPVGYPRRFAKIQRNPL